MKSPPIQYHDDQARELVEEFIKVNSKPAEKSAEEPSCGCVEKPAPKKKG
jgi:hypothetical protein